MKRLEDMQPPMSERTLMYLLLVAFLGGLSAYVISVIRNAEPAPSKQIALCSDEPDINDRINRIAFEALEKSLQQQIGHLFTTWMKDETGQPARAATGVKQAALAYVHAREAIYHWNIPRCTP